MNPIKSFIIRASRMSPRQIEGLEKGFPQFGWEGNPVSAFPRQQPLVLEIGFGMGDSFLEMARRRPEENFIGIEVHPPGVGHVLAQLVEKPLDNVRVVMADAIEILSQTIPDNSLSRIQIFFPDPWPKKRHHKRRLIRPAYLSLFRAKLQIGGFLHIATDWQPYSEAIDDLLHNDNNFICQSEGQIKFTRPDYRPLSKYERRGLALGHVVSDLIYEKTI